MSGGIDVNVCVGVRAVVQQRGDRRGDGDRADAADDGHTHSDSAGGGGVAQHAKHTVGGVATAQGVEVAEFWWQPVRFGLIAVEAPSHDIPPWDRRWTAARRVR